VHDRVEDGLGDAEAERTSCWLDRKASVIVVTQENPGGSSRR
jgi:hypothetical protein